MRGGVHDVGPLSLGGCSHRGAELVGGAEHRSDGNILAFLPGMHEILKTDEILHGHF